MFKRSIPVLLALCTLGVFGSVAQAAIPAPGWTLESFASPTNFGEGANTECLSHLNGPELFCDSFQVTARNAGSEPTDGTPVTLTDTLPEGVTVGVIQFLTGTGNTAQDHAAEDCTGKGRPKPSEPVRCMFHGVLAPDEILRMFVFVTVNEEASGSLTNKASVSGGGAPNVSTEATNQIGSNTSPFGLSSFDFFIDGPNGTRETQAGGHPYELTTTINLNNEFREADFTRPEFNSVEDLRDIIVDLPLGFAGSTLAAPECTLAQMSSAQHCPPETIVGHLFTEPENAATNIDSPIWNMVPEHGHPAEFAYIDTLHGAHVAGDVSAVPSPVGYVLRFTAAEIPQVPLTHIVVTFYGDPALRDATANPQIPFFINPTGCANGPMIATIHMDSWEHPARFNPDGTPVNLEEPAWAKAISQSPPVTGCNALGFTPELEAQPTTNMADSPSGLEFGLKLAQNETMGTLATPTLKNAVVRFPPGFTLDPSAGDGLQACSEAQIGWTGPTLFDFTPAPPQCPEASKIGSLELTTPLVPGTFHGEMYLAAQNENPYHSTIGLYVVVDDPVTGVLIKIAGRTLTDPQTGQITGVFDENPQLPFNNLKLSFFGGPRAEFATPKNCGLYTTNSELTPWSAPDSGPIGSPFDSFVINEACVNGFTPIFSGGSTNLQAAAYTPFVASFVRKDTDQEFGGLSVSLPPGLLANVASVPLCPEAQANAGSCPASTQVGTVDAGAGPGPNPLFVPGKVYLTGPYNGGPYGLSVVVPAIAGPFNFGLVVVRQSIRIDPSDAHVTDISDRFPTILNATGTDGQTIGIPIRLRRVDVSIDRSGFTFNPSNCGKLKVGGSITSNQGQSSALEVPFQVTNCATLKFPPKFSVSTSGKNSRANGASLTAKLSYPNAPQGTQVNIARVKVDLPKQLPSRLTTLQKACTNAQFNKNPADCPPASMIGHATVHTPILAGALSGPAIFVSHGGEAFPSLTMVLQGDGITVDLVGTTFINKAGITSTTFKTVPDTPFSTFELTLPQGKDSALAANGNLCKAKLIMPTLFVAQNGAEIHQSTKIGVTGCAKGKQAKHKKGRKANNGHNTKKPKKKN